MYRCWGLEHREGAVYDDENVWRKCEAATFPKSNSHVAILNWSQNTQTPHPTSIKDNQFSHPFHLWFRSILEPGVFSGRNLWIGRSGEGATFVGQCVLSMAWTWKQWKHGESASFWRKVFTRWIPISLHPWFWYVGALKGRLGLWLSLQRKLALADRHDW